jgi:signal transduction histidine kinase/DNA-binding response OmpR family regulator
MKWSSPWVWLTYQQDYLWFLVIAGACLTQVAWWRTPQKDPALRWVPVITGFSVAIAVVELSQLVSPVAVSPFEDPWLAWDFALGVTNALFASALMWLAAGAHRGARLGAGCVAILLAVGAGGRVHGHPLIGTSMAAAVATIGALLLTRGHTVPRGARIALIASAAAQWLGTAGPLAELIGSPHRLTEISPLGPAAAICLLAATIGPGTILVSRLLNGRERHALGTLFRGLIGWTLAGLLIAILMSHWARRNFERNLLSRVELGALLIDPAALRPALDPAFRLDELLASPQLPGVKAFYRSHHLARHEPRAISDGLSRIELANPDALWAMILVPRQGRLVFCAGSSHLASMAGVFGILGEVDSGSWRSWAERRAEVLGPQRFFYGDVIQARAPIVGQDRRMLGWLIMDFGLSHWLAAQIHARLLAYAVVMLGAALLFLNWRQRVREQEQLLAQHEAANARAASQLKTAFLAKVSHELRTPIQSLLGYSDLLRRQVAHDAKAASWLSSLQQHGELMTRLVNDLIDLSAVESGSFQLAPKVVPIPAVVQQTIESFRPRAEKQGLSLACFIDPSTPAAASLDGERFRQVLINLVGNAIKFTDRGGVTVAIQARPAGARQVLQLVVRDTGPGIPPSQQHRLFNAFSRLEATAAKEGSGLGLALSAALCRAMGGDLIVESDGVTGSAFAASFLVEPAELFEAKAPSAPGTSLRGRHILVVDDNRLLRELFVAFLTEQGALCAAAASGKQAVAQAAADRFDAVILDLALPDGDSTAIVEPLRATLPPGARIIGVSAHAGAADRARVLTAGMDAFLSKPVPLDVLAAAVAAAPANPPPLSAAEPIFDRLKAEFRRDAAEQRRRLDEAISTENWSAVQSQAHYLKNSATVLRDDALYEACTGLEQAALDADGAAVHAWWARCILRLDAWQASASLSPGA